MNRTLDPRRIEVVCDEVAEILRRKTPAERIAMVFESDKLVRMLAAGGVKMRHPDWNDEQVQREVARRILHGSERTVPVHD